jgi:hypothetical protein
MIGGYLGNTVATGATGAVVGGGTAGQANPVNNTFCTVGGGTNNVAGTITMGPTVALHATVSGGQTNTASNGAATVSGGGNNTATGQSSTVTRGQFNTASGSGSFAAGQSATAGHTGTFVWSDGSNGTTASTGAGQFIVRASGGVTFFTNNQPAANDTGKTLISHPR